MSSMLEPMCWSRCPLVVSMSATVPHSAHVCVTCKHKGALCMMLTQTQMWNGKLAFMLLSNIESPCSTFIGCECISYNGFFYQTETEMYCSKSALRAGSRDWTSELASDLQYNFSDMWCSLGFVAFLELNTIVHCPVRWFHLEKNLSSQLSSFGDDVPTEASSFCLFHLQQGCVPNKMDTAFC